MKSPTSKEAVGQRLHEILMTLGMTQKEFAKRAGLTQNAYTNYETGKRRPAVTVALRLLEAYGVSPDWLYAGEDPQSLLGSRKEKVRPKGGGVTR